jgi:hypothetical protein
VTKIYDQGTSLSYFDTDDLSKVYAYNADGTLKTETCICNGATYVKTYSYTSGKLTGESAWVKQ